jgi:hypothetical protein
MGTLFSSTTLALFTLVSTRGATGGETLTRFPTSILGTGEGDREYTAAEVVRSHGILPILVVNGLEANQDDSFSRNKDGDDTPYLLVLLQIDASGRASPTMRGPYGIKHNKLDPVGWDRACTCLELPKQPSRHPKQESPPLRVGLKLDG